MPAKKGRLAAACISATKSGELGARVVINQAAATSCIQVPIVDTADAIHKARNTGCRRGLHMDADADGAVIILGWGDGELTVPTPPREEPVQWTLSLA